MSYLFFTIGTILDTFHRLFLLSLGSYNLGINDPILKMRKLKLKEVKKLVPGHITFERHRWDSGHAC